MKLDGDLARIEHEGDRLVCGGGARLPQAAARAAALGLSGLEFGVNIPGTVGGAVRMNANAYGGELGRVLEWVDVCDRRRAPTAARPSELGFAYRRSNLGPREVVARASFALEPGEPASVKATLADMRARRKAAQPSGIKTFGSTFKNPDDPRAEGRTAGQLLEAAGCNGLEVGGARFSPKHANFIENRGDGDHRDVLELMAEGRRRVRERFGVSLEPEVQLLGDVELPVRGARRLTRRPAARRARSRRRLARGAAVLLAAPCAGAGRLARPGLVARLVAGAGATHVKISGSHDARGARDPARAAPGGDAA